MKVINFWNIKGGVGKSSICFLSGKFLASQGKRTLIIDLDSQRSLSHSLGFDDTGKTIFDFLSDSTSLDSLVKETSIQNLSYIPSSFKVLKIQNSVLQNKFKKSFKELSEKYDYILLDNSPSLNSLIIAGVSSSDRLVIPALISIFDLREVSFVLDEAKEINENLDVSIVLNRVQNIDKVSVDEAEYLEGFQSKFGNYLTKNKIPNSTLIRKAIDRGESLSKKSKTVEKFRNNFRGFMEEITGLNFQPELF